MPTLKEMHEAYERRKERSYGPPPLPGLHPPAQESNASASRTTSMLFGLGIVGMAAGYAMLGFRFRNIKAGTGFAEFRAAEHAAQHFSGARAGKEARASAQERAREGLREYESTHKRAEELGQQQGWQQKRQQKRQQEWREHGGYAAGRDGSVLRWAVDALQLDSLDGLTAQGVKSAYHKMAKLCHPDTGGDGADPERFKIVGRAKEAILRHIEER